MRSVPFSDKERLERWIIAYVPQGSFGHKDSQLSAVAQLSPIFILFSLKKKSIECITFIIGGKSETILK